MEVIDIWLKRKLSKRVYVPPSLKAAYDQVSRRADTDGTKINVTETYRVLSEFFVYLSRLPSDEAFQLVGKGIANAKKK